MLVISTWNINTVTVFAVSDEGVSIITTTTYTYHRFSVCPFSGLTRTMSKVSIVETIG